MEYPKINSLWKRDDNHNLIPGDYARPEFGAFKQWRVEEKIDGTNIRVYVHDGKTEVKGRTNKATEVEIVEIVRSKPTGRYNNNGYIMEGVMVRAEPLMRFNSQKAEPVMWKLKVKDFK